MKILVINAGSSSIKYQLMELEDVRHFTVQASGLVEKIGESVGRVIHKTFIDGKEKKTVEEAPLPTHREGMARVVALLTDPQQGVIRDVSEIQGVGHRVVLCGEAYTAPVLITQQVKETIREFFPLSPLHNPPNLMGIEVAEEFFPHAAQVGVLDTAFHQTLPPKAYLYAVPNEWYTQHRLRRYGFHGTSHKFIAHATAAFLGKSPEQTSLISLHLGNGCSMAAIRKGKSVDTSMGVTPLEGLMMGTRSGDLDPAALEYIMGQTGMDIHQVTTALNKQSGLKGICGVNDMREIVEAAESGSEQAETALQMWSRLKPLCRCMPTASRNISAPIWLWFPRSMPSSSLRASAKTPHRSAPVSVPGSNISEFSWMRQKMRRHPASRAGSRPMMLPFPFW